MTWGGAGPARPGPWLSQGLGHPGTGRGPVVSGVWDDQTGSRPRVAPEGQAVRSWSFLACKMGARITKRVTFSALEQVDGPAPRLTHSSALPGRGRRGAKGQVALSSGWWCRGAAACWACPTCFCGGGRGHVMLVWLSPLCSLQSPWLFNRRLLREALPDCLPLLWASLLFPCGSATAYFCPSAGWLPSRPWGVSAPQGRPVLSCSLLSPKCPGWGLAHSRSSVKFVVSVWVGHPASCPGGRACYSHFTYKESETGQFWSIAVGVDRALT